MDGRGTYSKQWDQEEESIERGNPSFDRNSRMPHNHARPPNHLLIGIVIAVLVIFLLALLIVKFASLGS